jgi:hypothetical protein
MKSLQKQVGVGQKKAMNKLNTQGLESNHCLNLISHGRIVKISDLIFNLDKKMQ